MFMYHNAIGFIDKNMKTMDKNNNFNIPIDDGKRWCRRG